MDFEALQPATITSLSVAAKCGDVDTLKVIFNLLSEGLWVRYKKYLNSLRIVNFVKNNLTKCILNSPHLNSFKTG